METVDRVDHFKKVYRKFPASHPWLVREQDRDVIYAIWVLGQDYRNKTRLYGAYPPDYVKRIEALFPDAESTLHAFSGSLPSGNYHRIDLIDRVSAYDGKFTSGDVCDAFDLYGPNAFDLIVADPPYSDDDAVKYETPMVNRLKAMAALATVIVRGGHLVWLDTMWPIHSKESWVTVGRIPVIRSTNHRVRLCSIFERV